jgi:Nuclease-related domain
VLRGRKQRFYGAGGSAEREFKRQLRKNIRDDWKLWAVGVVLIVGAAVWSFYTGRVAGRIFAATSGFAAGMLAVIYSLGGHISAFRWWLGAEGERETAKQIEKLGPEWHCEHDLEHGHGNYDHVLVGPAGVFLLDSKLLHGTAAAGEDSLRSGRVAYPGGAFRYGAKQVKVALEERLGFRAPWVQSVVVIWGDFPQGRHEEHDIVYLRGEELLPWLSELPKKVNAPQRAAYVTALREVRDSLASRSSGS